MSRNDFSGQSVQGNSSKINHILKKVEKLLVTELSPLMQTYYEAADDGLYDLSERARSNQEQTQSFQSMQELRRKKELITREFFNNIADTFKLFKQGTFHYFHNESADELSTRELTLMEEQELDKMLAVSSSISKAKTYLSRQLFDLHKRFGVLTDHSREDVTDIPISPNVIVHAFVNGLKIQEGVSSTVFVVLVKIFERAIILNMAHVYDVINQCLINEGILPNLRLKAKSTGGSAGYARQNTPPKNKVPELAKQINELAAQTFSEDSSFAEILAALTSNQKEFAGDTQDFGSSTMNMALSLLQLDQLKKLNEANVKINPDELRIDPSQLKEGVLSKLKDLGNEDAEKKIDQVDEVIIDMVSLLFQYVIEDKSLPAPIQDLLLQLQVPYLNFAINDRSIFANKEHVARLLLEKLAESSIGWNEKHDIKNRYFNYIKDLVDHITKSEADKVDFNALLKSFDTFQAKNKKRMLIAEKRESAKAMGMERLNLAKRKTAKVMQKNMHQRSIPKLVKEILLKDWVNVLTLEFLRSDEDETDVEGKTEFVKELIHAAQRNKKIKTPAARQTELCDQLEAELRNLTYNESEIKEKCTALADLLATLNFDPNDNSMFEFDEDDDLAPYKPDNEPIIDPNAPGEEKIQSDINQAMNLEPVKEYEVIADNHADQAADLKLGTWMDITLDGEVKRGKLSWISPITNDRLIVNARGQKLCNITLPELAQGLRNKSITVVETKPLFERVLKTISSEVKK